MHLRESTCPWPAFVAVLLLGASPPAFAGWPSAPETNVPACTAPGAQVFLQSASDGKGGAILAWADDRPGAVGIYVQRLTVYGTPAWATDGVRIHTPPLGTIDAVRHVVGGTLENNLAIVADGAGGAIVAWRDSVGPGDTDILAQRVDRTGAILWDAAGVPVCRAPGQQTGPVATSDGAGGAIVAWEDGRDGPPTVRAQRVTAGGSCAWTADGVLASSSAEAHQQPEWASLALVARSDGAGGALLAWASARGIVAQRLDAGGARLWSDAGVAACNHLRIESTPDIVSDDRQGAFVSWHDYRNGGGGVYVQRILATGDLRWENGLAIVDGGFDSWLARLAPDGLGGCILVWQDTRPYYCWPCNGAWVMAQRLDSGNNVLWTPGGVRVSDASRGAGAVNMRIYPQVVPDGEGGVLLTYMLNVTGDQAYTGCDVYAQRVRPDGTRAWANDAVVSCAALGQGNPVLVQSQPGAALIAWEDGRNGNGDIYAQRVAEDGLLRAPVTFTDTGAGLSGSSGWESFAWGDYDNDGDLDLLRSTMPDYTGMCIYRNSAGSFERIDAGLPPYGQVNAIWGDFDSDGWLDVATNGAIYRNNRDGTFSDVHAAIEALFIGYVSCADYDADGDLDLLEVGLRGVHEIPTTQLYRNDGNGVFTAVSVGLGPTYLASMAWADYDRDGHLDLLLGGQLYHNKGNTTFLHVQAGLPDLSMGRSAWGDYDSDGFPDVALAGSGLYHNHRDGTFTLVGGLALPDGDVTWGDFDNDGRLDLALTGSGGSPGTIYRNEGDGLFTDIGAGFPGASLALGDFDGDGDLDVLASGSGYPAVPLMLYRSDGAPPNTPPAAPDGPWSIDVSGGYVTLGWTPTTDAQTPADALTYNLRIGTTPGGSEIMPAMSDPASGFRRVVQMGNAGTVRSLTLHLPQQESHLYWSVQAVDGAYAGSPFSAERFFGPVPTLPCLFTLDAEPSVVRLVWYAAAELPGAATLYRRDAGSDWAALATISADGSGYLRYEDTAVESGTRYGYRLGVADGTGQAFTEETWADVPRAVVEFALERVTPNPSRDGTVSVQLSVPVGPAARLELVDVRGRRVCEQKLQGPGRFSIQLGHDRRLGSGVYFVRLAQGEKVRVERATVLQ